MQVARDGDGRCGQLTALDVVTTLEGNTCLGGEVDRAVEADGLRDVAPETRRAVVYIGNRVVDGLVEAQVPR